MTTITVRSSDLHNLLKTALVFASKDTTLPMLTCVKIDRVGNELIAASTDRFRLAVIRIDVEEHDTEPFSVLLPRDQITATLPSLKVPVKDADWQKVALKAEDGKVSWVRTDNMSGSLTDRTDDYQFPQYWNLMQPDAGDVMDSPQRSTVGLDPAYLADWSKGKWSPRDTLIIEPGETHGRPVTIRVGKHLIGIQMPFRTANSEANSHETRAAWGGILDSLKAG